jgi:hypothetical protein
MSIGCGSSLFGPSSQYIKTNAGDIVATDGSNTRERLILSDLRIPYKQILKSRVILKAGQIDYLLNHLGLGDNATFLAIRTTYDVKSTIEADNYVKWTYYDNMIDSNSFASVMVLTGNSVNRIKQIYLTNPNSKYPVYLDVMVAVLDDNYSYFSDIVNQTATTFTGLEYTDIDSYVVGQSIVVYDKNSPKRALIYFTIADINSIEREGTILTVDDSLKVVLLKFLTEYDAIQAQSLLNFIIENPGANIGDFDPLADSTDPVVYFYSKVGASASTDYIRFNGATVSVPYDTSYGYTFSTSISLDAYGSASVLDKNALIGILISSIGDDRDGTMSIIPSNIILKNSFDVEVASIGATGSYEMTFDFSDIAQNYLDGVIVSLDIL